MIRQHRSCKHADHSGYPEKAGAEPEHSRFERNGDHEQTGTAE